MLAEIGDSGRREIGAAEYFDDLVFVKLQLGPLTPIKLFSLT